MNKLRFISILVFLLFWSEVDGQTFSKYYDFNGLETSTCIIPKDSIYVISINGGNPFASDSTKFNHIILLQIDKDGDTVGLKRIAKDKTEFFTSYATTITPISSGYLFTGSLGDSTGNRDALLMRLSPDLDTLWSRTYSGNQKSGWSAVVNESKNYFLIGGDYRDSAGLYQPYLIKVDTAGNLLWEKKYLFPSKGGFGSSVIQMDDESIYITGGGCKNEVKTHYMDAMVIKIDSSGNKVWDKVWGTQNTMYEAVLGIKTLRNTLLLFGGKDNPLNFSWDYKCDAYIAEMDTSGSILWEHYIGYQNISSNPSFASAIQLDDSSIVACGLYSNNNNGEGMLMKFSQDGDSIWRRNFYFTPGTNHYLWDLTEAPDGGFVITGFGWQTNPGNQDVWVLKVDSMGCLTPGCHLTGFEPEFVFDDDWYRLYPNPVSEKLTVHLRPGLSGSLRLYDMQGRLALQREITGVTEFEPALPAGLYLYRIDTGEKSASGKLMVE